MKNIINAIICLFYGVSAVAQSVEPADFTRLVINEYLSQEVKTASAGTIIVHTWDDEHHYYMQIFDDTAGYYDVSGMNEMAFDGTEVKVAGVPVPFLFGGNPKPWHIKEKSNVYINYDPVIWQVAFHKDGTLCKMFTHKGTADGRIDDIIALSSQCLAGVSLVGYDEEYVYNNALVDTPARFEYGDLQKMMAANVKVKRGAMCQSIPVIINMIIDKDGNARIGEFVRKSEYEDVNMDAFHVAEIISGYKFVPAVHRGERVCVNYALFFPKRLWEERTLN
ncbi:MAG: hypothetical protein NC115_10980 [Bacteroidales bacterium]|nr:hypothetical protein [Bacteroidales bacterium]